MHSYTRVIQKNHYPPLFSLLFYCCIAIVPAGVSAKTPDCSDHKRPIRSLSKDQVLNEISYIRTIRADIGLYHAEGDEIQLRSPCNTHWKQMKAYKHKHETMKNRMLYADEINVLRAKQQQEKSKYRACFTEELRKHPSIYNHDLVPSRTIDEFDATITKLQKEFSSCKMASRFLDLKNALKRK